MILRNKKTGEIVDLTGDINYSDGRIIRLNPFCSLAELCDEWEDCKVSKGYWYIESMCAGVQYKEDTNNGEDSFNKKIGNYFETEEDAEEAVEKLKALKRLQITSDACSYRLAGTNEGRGGIESFVYEIHIDFETMPDKSDMDKLFGCEE